MRSSGVQPSRYQLCTQGSVCGPWQPLCLFSVCQPPRMLYLDQITQQRNKLFFFFVCFFTQEPKSDPVSVSGAACFTLANRRQRGKEGWWGRRGGRGGVIPTKTWLRSVIERKNVLADRPFQPGHLEVLDQLGRSR